MSDIVNPSTGDVTDHVAIADNYTYSSSLITDLGGDMITSFEFNAELKDNNLQVGDDSTNAPSRFGPDTILLSYKNPNSFLGTGTISYNIRYGV